MMSADLHRTSLRNWDRISLNNSTFKIQFKMSYKSDFKKYNFANLSYLYVFWKGFFKHTDSLIEVKFLHRHHHIRTILTIQIEGRNLWKTMKSNYQLSILRVTLFVNNILIYLQIGIDNVQVNIKSPLSFLI